MVLKCRDYCSCAFQLPAALELVINRFIVHASAAARRNLKLFGGYRQVQPIIASPDNANRDLTT
jgi:hypothetical protein